MRANKYEVLMETLPDGVQIWLTAETEDITPRRETELLRMDPAQARSFRQAVQENTDKAGRWGWCTIKTSYVKDGLVAVSYLGSCSYLGPEDYKAGGYYEQKVDEARQEWERGNRLPV